jgi:hypothetical protein
VSAARSFTDPMSKPENNDVCSAPDEDGVQTIPDVSKSAWRHPAVTLSFPVARITSSQKS